MTFEENQETSVRKIHRRQFLKDCLIGSIASCLWPPRITADLPIKNYNGANVIIISIDTLRADHLGCYGYPRNTSPNIDHFSSTAVTYTHALAPTPWTLPSHAAMLTGIHPYVLGIKDLAGTIPGKVATLAQLLKRAGYQTAAFVDSHNDGFVGANRGFGRGFDAYHHIPHSDNPVSRFDVKATIDASQKWIQSRTREKPFFLFIHSKAVHTVAIDEAYPPHYYPYDKPPPYKRMFLTAKEAGMDWIIDENIRAQRYLLEMNRAFAAGIEQPLDFPRDRIQSLIGQYDGGIRYTDRHIGRFHDFLQMKKLLDNTIIIITSDHGEAFLEHNFFMHVELYKQLLHVPLLLFLPNSPGGLKIHSPVALEDISPTILQLLGLAVPSTVTGKKCPLVGWTNDLTRPFYAYYSFGKTAFYEASSLQRGPWKIIISQMANKPWKTELFALSSDPDESKPVPENNDVRQELTGLLQTFLRKEGLMSGNSIDISPETQSLLKSLGYID